MDLSSCLRCTQSQIDKLLGLTNDPEFQVRLKMSKLITVLFESWEGHWDLLQDLRSGPVGLQDEVVLSASSLGSTDASLE